MSRTKAIALCACMAASFGSAAPCQETARIGAAEGPSVGSSALAALEESQPLSFYGSLSSAVGGALGWPRNPLQEGRDIAGEAEGAAGFSVSNTLGFDARPDGSFRAHGAMAVSSPSYQVSVSELFFDYSVADAVFIRGGMQGLSWIDSRIFGVGDILSGFSKAVSLKAYVPFGPFGVSLAAFADGIAAGIVPAAKISYAARAEAAFGKFEMAESGAYRNDGTLLFSSTARTSVAGIDIYAQGFGELAPETGAELCLLAGAFWESAEPRIKVSAEYLLDGSSGTANDHRAAIGLGWRPTGSEGFKLGLLWIHAFADSSGGFLPAFSFEPARHLAFSFAAPITYGEAKSIYASKVPPGLDMPFDWSQKYSLFAKIAVSVDY